MDKILISACLCGENCTYKKGNNYHKVAKDLVDSGKAIMVCPEVDGGLSTPRPPAEIIGDKVINSEGVDVTKEYKKGAQVALDTAIENNVSLAILQARSPSCGSHYIYDGSFSKRLIKGEGTTVSLLRQNGIKVMTIDDYIKANNIVLTRK